MSTNPPYGSGAEGVGRRIDEAIARIEAEVRQAAAYVNDNVIPQVRTESIFALRNVADSLRKFADQLDVSARSSQSGPSQPQPPKPPNP
jgi:hypothetical protein